jgi:hypothetical protein
MHQNKTSFHSRRIVATDFIGEKALVTGWGRSIQTSQAMNPVLKGAILTVASNLECFTLQPLVSI